MNKDSKKDRELHKYLSRFGDYQSIIVAAGHLKKSQIEALIKKEKLKIHGGEFYHSIEDVKGDIDAACEILFGDLELPKYEKSIGKNKDKTPLGNYLEQFIVEQKDIAAKIGTDPSSLNRFIKGTREIFAYQIYFIAKVYKKQASEVFRELYGMKEENDKI